MLQLPGGLLPGAERWRCAGKTIADLAALYPACESLAIVPLGVTGHREGLAELKPVARQSAREMLAIAEKWQEKMLEEQGTRFVFCSDELYIRAEKELPPYAAYEDFAQMEDGVGMVQNFLYEVDDALENFQGKAELGGSFCGDGGGCSALFAPGGRALRTKTWR